MSPKGKTDPAAELDSTLAAFFSANPVGAEPQPAQCAFVARYNWLRHELGFDPDRLPPQPCPGYTAWRRQVDAVSATLVFTSAYLNNPASLFGHTLLRLDGRGQTEDTRLLAFAVNYAADDSRSSGLMYAIDGIFGGFTGHFDVQPYDHLVHGYSDRESRDIWEYRLKLDPAVLERLLDHIWELRGVDFDYFFFRENCAWQLLTLLEAADPRLDLSERFSLWTPPPDTVRLLEQLGLIEAVTPRPARGSAIRRVYEGLDTDDQAIARRLRRDVSQLNSPEFLRLPAPRQARLLELALDERQNRRSAAQTRGSDSPPAPDADIHRLLDARASLPRIAPFPVQPYATRPEAGHASRRLELGAVRQDGVGALRLGARAAFHDGLEPDAGYAPDAGIQILDLALHHDETGRTRLHHLTLLELSALQPFNALLPRPAWQAKAGWAPAPRGACPDCLALRGEARLGLSMDSAGPWRTLWYALPGLVAEHGVGPRAPDRGGPSLTLGLLSQALPGLKIGAEVERVAYQWGERSTVNRRTLASHIALGRDLALRAEWKQDGVQRSLSLSLFSYF